MISTPMPEVRLYERLIEIIDSPIQFEKTVEKIINKPAENPRDLSREMSKENWIEKVKLISSHLERDI